MPPYILYRTIQNILTLEILYRTIQVNLSNKRMFVRQVCREAKKISRTRKKCLKTRVIINVSKLVSFDEFCDTPSRSEYCMNLGYARFDG